MPDLNKSVAERSKNIVLFDGTCKLCNNAVKFITRNDSRHYFCFIPLESERAAAYLRFYRSGNIDKGSMLLIMGDRIYMKSDAVLRILRLLDGLWPVLYVFLIVPRFIRDPVYDIVSKYRYKWFGPCVGCPEFRPCSPD
jgi:predicted DCC family thiol-disulfide oxidoreductase YuxK